MKSILLVALLALCGSAVAGVYRWVDAEGKVHYSDTPPPSDARNVQQKKLGASVIEGSEAPYAVQQAARNFPVVLFITDCGQACNKARELLAKRGVPYTERNPQQNEADMEDLKKLTAGALEVPVLTVGAVVLRGFETSQWNEALDSAGYSKTARSPQKPKTVQPAPRPAEESTPQETAPPEPK